MENDIREQITRDDVLAAIDAIDRGDSHEFGPSTGYDVLLNGRRYPPKAVIGLAVGKVRGRPVRPDEFKGGQRSWSFRRLRELGFSVVDKEGHSGDQELPPQSPPRVWIENTKTDVHNHGGPGWEFGTCLWSPSANAAGSDSYTLMREPQVDDLVIHVNNGELAGWSFVAAPYRELTESPPSPGPWADRGSYFRIDLKDFHEFPNIVPLKDFVERNRVAIQEELKSDGPKRYLFVSYGGQEVRLAQGAYLTRCTPVLESEKFAAQLLQAGATPTLVEKIRRGIGTLNTQISADSDLGDGFLIGHSFFCPSTKDVSVDEDWYRVVVDTEVEPLIREYWFDKRQTDLETILRQLRETS